MTNRRHMAIKGAPPTYAERKEKQPIRTEGRDKQPCVIQSIKYIVCSICLKPGGTLIHNGKAYVHKSCLISRQNLLLRKEVK